MPNGCPAAWRRVAGSRTATESAGHRSQLRPLIGERVAWSRLRSSVASCRSVRHEACPCHNRRHTGRTVPPCRAVGPARRATIRTGRPHHAARFGPGAVSEAARSVHFHGQRRARGCGGRRPLRPHNTLRSPSAVEHGVPPRPAPAGHTPRPAPQKDPHDLRRPPDGLPQGPCPARRPRGRGPAVSRPVCDLVPPGRPQAVPGHPYRRRPAPTPGSATSAQTCSTTSRAPRRNGPTRPCSRDVRPAHPTISPS